MIIVALHKVKGQKRKISIVEHGARWFSHASVLTGITSDNDELSKVIKMLVNKDCDYSVNGIISDNFR